MNSLLMLATLLSAFAILWSIWRKRVMASRVAKVPPSLDMALGVPLRIPPLKRVDSVEDAILYRIRTQLSLWGGGRAILRREDALLVKWVFDHEYVEKDSIGKAVHARLCEIGREVYEWHIRAPLTNYPDHSVSPEALGYAISHGIISEEEIPKIRFDHDETAEEYRKLAEGLLGKVMSQLATGKTYFDCSKSAHVESMDHHHCCCSH